MKYLFLAAIAPIIILLAYIHKKDPHPESKKLLRKIFIFGCLTTIPVMFAEGAYTAMFGETETFMGVFMGVALVEEFFKWIVIYILCYRNQEFDESYDAIVYSAFSSLGFACIENILYVVFMGGIGVGILRALTAVPGHLCHAIVMGYFIGKARSAKAKGQSAGGYLFLSLLMPVLTHCLYDYFLVAEQVFAWLFFTIALFIACFVITKNASKNNEVFATTSPTPQPIQANPVAQPAQQAQPAQVIQAAQPAPAQTPAPEASVIPVEQSAPQTTSSEPVVPPTQNTTPATPVPQDTQQKIQS